MPADTRAADCAECGERIDAHENATIQGEVGKNVGACLQGMMDTNARIVHERCVDLVGIERLTTTESLTPEESGRVR